MLRSLSLGLLTLVVATTSTFAQVTLERKYIEGTKAVVQSEQKTTQTLTLNGMNIDTKSTMFVVATSTIGNRDADGKLKIEEKVDTLQGEITFPGGSIQFDSANPDKKQDNPLLEGISDALRTAYRLVKTTTLDKKNEVVDVTLPDGEFEKLTEESKAYLGKDALKKQAEQASSFLPSEPVKKGDTWERSTDANLGGGQTMAFRIKYECAGTVEENGQKLDKIVGKPFEVTYSTDPNGQFQVTKSEFKITESDNVYLFDRDRGHVVSHTSKMKIVGPLTLSIGGMTFDGNLDLVLEEKSTRQK
jgi:hypothetical protein